MKIRSHALLFAALVWLAPLAGASAQSLSYNSGQNVAPGYEGWEEDADRKAGYFHDQSAVPSSSDDLILQGPHLTVANPFARQPNENARARRG